MEFSSLSNSPLQQLFAPVFDEAGVHIYLKRDDLIHPEFGGNKWRKLKYNLIAARDKKYSTLLTFGGAWSNHIYATASAGKHFGFNTIGIIRGEPHQPLNPTLSFASKCGMQLHYVNRESYRHKHHQHYLDELRQKFGRVYILPEGGSNDLAVRGCREITEEVNRQISEPIDTICCACGTGGTLAGIISGLSAGQSAIGFSALKGGDFLNTEVEKLLPEASENWNIETRYHFGGYAKSSPELIDFIKQFYHTHEVMLDVVYTGKMLYGLIQKIQQGEFKSGSRIVAIHSGGLQGNRGFGL